ncbi:MAG: biopolymer transporter ExbD [Helicobacteraceae bacterium 4484_230]|nr:MAG: biopolymer transporter ExbD [Helicobacteraceae bacterium 4484_230]
MVYDWDEKPELNITPLVDVMLVLLAIMMVIAPNIVYEELINLPQGSAKKELSEKKPVHITINKEGQAVLISADKSLDYGLVMSVLAAVKQAGFSEVSLATNG